MSTDDIEKLHLNAYLAITKLNVARNMSPVIAILVGLLVERYFESWLWALIVGVLTYFFAMWEYKEERTKTIKAYERAAGKEWYPVKDFDPDKDWNSDE